MADDAGASRRDDGRRGATPGAASEVAPRAAASGVETIVAPCTAAGAGERAAVRLSGPDAWVIARAVVHVDGDFVPGRDHPASLPLGADVCVPVTCLCWRAPRSYTGEDVIELHVPGWPPLVTEVVRRAVAAGARPAGRGEFARRAWLAGRLGTAQVLALRQLVDARDAAGARAAASALVRPAAPSHTPLREALLAALVLVEAHVDFEEEDTEAVSADALRAALRAAAQVAAHDVERGSAATPADGVTDVVLLGPPNAGKSRLFTVLCPGARAAVSPRPGTTRDVLEGRAEWDGRAVRVLDGPGYDLAASDALDRLAMERHLSRVPPDAVVLLVAEARPPTDPARSDDEAVLAACARAAAGRALVRVDSQIDRRPELAPGRVACPDGTRRVAVSAEAGLGLQALRAAVLEAAPAAPAPDVAALLDLRAARLVTPLLEEALALPLPGALPLVALLLREGLARLDADPDDARDLDEEILDRIFAGFCVGK